ncbi:MAG TPA: methyltransferase domain-containing protein [Puia sp.]|nr:methyltransferase domain-containing protein [Puia sp.]
MAATTNDMKWNARLYDDKHNFVFKFGEDVVQLLNPRQGERILDLGCGTGFLTNLIAQAGARVIGIDKSPAMIERAQAAYPDLDFRVLPATDFHFDTSFDAVFSNAVLHWVLDKDAAIGNIYHALRPGGRLVLEMGGKGNIEGVLVATRKALTRHGYYSNAAAQVWYFPSLAEYTTLLERRGFRIQFAAHFDRPTELQDTENGIKDWLRMFGSAFFNDIPEDQAGDILEEIQDMLKPTHYKNHTWFADYKRLRIEAFKQY